MDAKLLHQTIADQAKTVATQAETIAYLVKKLPTGTLIFSFQIIIKPPFLNNNINTFVREILKSFPIYYVNAHLKAVFACT